ncbi:MAG TPA: 4a-hydroxytetrahydrobiopterin dehydratase [Ktedonobacteraceae bacterium]|jgi:4a-hydroxytetrahydrobiopterin dehydratase|nr:4a-hydroxytetrahydrobiopterin dehydratase [Ktedonobacteraceae bacterium]
MADLKHMKCEACGPGTPPVSDEESSELQRQVPEWSIVERDGVRRLERVFKVKDFATALAFANRIGEIAEQEGHHPALLIEWGKVGVVWWTHSIGGLHRNDFIMAAKTDQAYKHFD